MVLCNCKINNIKTTVIGIWNGCPLKSGGHTNFFVLKCNECKGIIGFPNDNLLIALKEGTEKTKKKLTEIIDD